nr:retrovirus-related Pol polyprotein from transposon TNT 1-94 [Tanacetum cinerariifolium]
MIIYSAYFDNDKQHRKQIADQRDLFDKMSVQMVELDKHVRDLKNTVLEKDFKIFELEECVRNKDLEIEKFLERLNVYENKLHKMGQTNQTVHMDLCGPMRVQSINGKRYVLVVVDDYSRYTWVFFLHSKDEASERVRTDNGTEFKNKTLAMFFDEVGITQQFSAARTPQQNGVVEMRNRTLVEAARTMLTFANQPSFLWAKAIATACFTQNRSIIHKHFDKPPYELRNKRKPNIKFFCVFGCRCYFLNDSDDVGKLKAKGDIGVFVGYSKESAAFRIYNKRTRESSSSSLNDDVQQSPEEVIPPQINTQSISINMVPNGDEARTSHNVFNERLEDAYFDASTSFHDPSNVHTFYQPYPHEKKWTKDHPLHKIIGDPKLSVRTRGFVSKQYPYHVYALDKALYGLKQAPRAWYDVLLQFLIFSAARTPQQNGVVERRNRTLVEAARTMLTFANLPSFLWAEAIETICFTQNRSIIHKRFDKTPYELMNRRKPNIKFFRVFGCRCYLLNDYEDVRKLKAKGDIGVLEPVLSNLNETGKSLNLSVSQVDEASKKDLEDLFQDFYDEYFDSSKIMKSSTTNVETPINEEVFHESIPINMVPNGDEASTSHNVFNERLDDAYFDASTSFHDPSNVQTFYQPYPHEKKWTKDHPLHKIIGDPTSSVRTKGQLANSCLFSCLLSSIEPLNVLRDVDWVSAMQEELDQFARL